MGETIIAFMFSLLLFIHGTADTILFRISNNCTYPIWPGLLPDYGAPELPTTGFLLSEGQSVELSSPSEWSGRIWGRTNCHQDPASDSIHSCTTGDCGSTECRAGAGIIPPFTAAIISGALHGMPIRYGVSLADGFNLPMSIVPLSRSGSCYEVGCAVDLNLNCPEEIRVKKYDEVIACQSCTAAPQLCSTTLSKEFFKTKCPNADVGDIAVVGGNSCKDADHFLITFCPSDNHSSKSKGDKEIKSSLKNFFRHWKWSGSIGIIIIIVAGAIASNYGGLSCICSFWSNNNVNLLETAEHKETELPGTEVQGLSSSS